MDIVFFIEKSVLKLMRYDVFIYKLSKLFDKMREIDQNRFAYMQ